MSNRDDDGATYAATPAAQGRRGAASTDEDTFETLADGIESLSVPVVEARSHEPTAASYGERYRTKRTIGQGGMGEVLLCHDETIGRDVAVKVMLSQAAGNSVARERFLREGRVQAQLEHPGVVPIYDIGVNPSGQPYIAMKRVRGRTLRAVIRGLRDGDPEVQSKHPRASLLSVIARVCETVAYAHSRGVVHRDLKPANVMLGDFGEVSVLDWGVAKVRSESDLEAAPKEPSYEESDFTVPGSVLGTPGYMAPEQASGDPADARADVYALGAMLYEVVTLERLHSGDSGDQRLASTIRGADARPSTRVPGVPAELDAICVRATHVLRNHRHATAGELLEELRLFVDGQRASELRREIAGRHAEAARTSLASPRDASMTARYEALRDLGAAVVLDPENEEMIQMIEAVLDPDAEVPAAVERKLEADRRAAASRAAARSGLAYVAALLLLPVVLWMGVRDWVVFAVLAVGLVGSAFGALSMWKTGRSTGLTAWAAAPFAFGLAGILSTLFGSFILVPAIVGTTTVAFTISVRPSRALSRFLIVCGAAAILVPAALSALGVTEPSLRFANGVIEVLPRFTSFPEVPTTVLLATTTVFVVTVSNLLVGRAVESLSAAERRLFVQAHRLRAMLPSRRAPA